MITMPRLTGRRRERKIEPRLVANGDRAKRFLIGVVFQSGLGMQGLWLWAAAAADGCARCTSSSCCPPTLIAGAKSLQAWLSDFRRSFSRKLGREAGFL